MKLATLLAFLALLLAPILSTRAAAPTPAPYQDQLISSVVIKVLPEGLLVWYAEKKPGLLRNHPRQKQLADGDTIKVHARRADVFKYTSDLGTPVTIPAFEYLRQAP